MKTERLDTLANRRLSALQFEGEHAVLSAILKEPRRMPGASRRFRLALILALVLITLLGTALALGLLYSSGYSARKAADRALMDRYGFHLETMGMFWVKEKKEEGQTTFTYTSHMNDEKTGIYTVVLPDKGQPQTAWTLEDADPAQFKDGSLEAPLWGPRQLNTYLKLKNAYYGKAGELDWTQVHTWSLQQRAEVFGLLNEMERAFGGAVFETNLVPGPEDITEEEAVRIAREALIKTYGLTEDALTGYWPTITFTSRTEDPARRYTIQFRRQDPAEYSYKLPESSFQIQVLSPSGETRKLIWSLKDPARRSLPEGDLAPYRHAVQEYMETGAFDALSAADKGRLAQRMVKAGFTNLLKDKAYIIPGPGLLSEEEAIQGAEAALLAEYDLTQEMLSLFTRALSLQRLDSQVVWQLVYTGRSFNHQDVVLFPPLGEYEVRLLAQDGQVLKADWSLKGVETREFTPSTWGQAQAYDARILPWLMDLYTAQEQILSQYDEKNWMMSLADKAAYDALCRDNGFDPARYPRDLPRDKELTEDAARAIALQALREELQLTDAVISQFSLTEPDFYRYPGFMRAQSTDPLWLFRFHHREGIYLVFLSALNGELILVEYEPAAAGNG